MQVSIKKTTDTQYTLSTNAGHLYTFVNSCLFVLFFFLSFLHKHIYRRLRAKHAEVTKLELSKNRRFGSFLKIIWIEI